MKASELPADASAYCLHAVPHTHWFYKTKFCGEKLAPDENGDLRCRKHGTDFERHE